MSQVSLLANPWNRKLHLSKFDILTPFPEVGALSHPAADTIARIAARFPMRFNPSLAPKRSSPTSLTVCVYLSLAVLPCLPIKEFAIAYHDESNHRFFEHAFIRKSDRGWPLASDERSTRPSGYETSIRGETQRADVELTSILYLSTSEPDNFPLFLSSPKPASLGPTIHPPIHPSTPTGRRVARPLLPPFVARRLPHGVIHGRPKTICCESALPIGTRPRPRLRSPSATAAATASTSRPSSTATASASPSAASGSVYAAASTP
ncbi:hypothetical protein F4680DRAFT_446854 [Xylaria scruposa]|nr:hypothetical protein F4680DRAFT_446854 [Xylaria scruposa]